MTQREIGTIVDQAGQRAKLIEVQGANGQPARLLALTDRGQRIALSDDLIQRQDDGTRIVPFTFSELERQSEGYGTEQVVIPVVSEQLKVGRRTTETGRVRLTKLVHEEEQVIDEPIVRDEVVVERVPANRPLKQPMETHYDGDTLVIPVLEEVLIVRKQLMLKEEIHIVKRRTTTSEPQRVAVRQEQVRVEKLHKEGS
ncbi:MAG: YsnF/AvaK domain-containing protein [Anaerolineae bacterium]